MNRARPSIPLPPPPGLDAETLDLAGLPPEWRHLEGRIRAVEGQVRALVEALDRDRDGRIDPVALAPWLRGLMVLIVSGALVGLYALTPAPERADLAPGLASGVALAGLAGLGEAALVLAFLRREHGRG